MGGRGLLTRWIAICEDELTVLTAKGGGVPDRLIEQRDETAIVAWGTVARYDLIRERDVVLVVGRIQLTVPA